ncbi:unnamed protein product [Didymodactylos carnosus]|uniref:B30.2/SPRY domain-containing protein n=1 Tax=Didymodactylos carnosus TaxID=1234261 RepID=A0A8S2CQD2_9BILA|nr:unnamed protein product [Didymodactylos carnosus]CAF3512919.1 unnamed protein product [Didymodactylos carnosus]
MVLEQTETVEDDNICVLHRYYHTCYVETQFVSMSDDSDDNDSGYYSAPNLTNRRILYVCTKSASSNRGRMPEKYQTYVTSPISKSRNSGQQSRRELAIDNLSDYDETHSRPLYERENDDKYLAPRRKNHRWFESPIDGPIRSINVDENYFNDDVRTTTAAAKLHQWQQQKEQQQITSTSILNFISSRRMEYVLLDKKKHRSCQNCISVNWSFSSPSSTDTKICEVDSSRNECYKPCIIPNVIVDGDYIMFHPRRSSSTCVLLGNCPLPSTGKHYWELFIPAVYGTSIMFGVATKQQKLSCTGFKDLIGTDENGWGLSHNGYLWQNGTCKRYMKPLQVLESALIGLLYDSDNDTLSYTINGEHRGIAFKSLKNNNNNCFLYPAISSTSAQSIVILGHRCKTCSTLKENCLRKLRTMVVEHNNNQFDLPKHLLQQFNNHEKRLQNSTSYQKDRINIDHITDEECKTLTSLILDNTAYLSNIVEVHNNNIFIYYCIIRQALSQRTAAAIFGKSQSQISYIMNNTTNKLKAQFVDKFLGSTAWSRDRIIQETPRWITDVVPNARCLIDTTYLYIQKTKDFSIQKRHILCTKVAI